MAALVEDMTINNITMRDVRNAPLFLRLGRRMRGPQGVPVGRMKRVLLSNISGSGALPEICSLITGIPGHRIEDVKISDVYLHQIGGGTKAMAAVNPPERESDYPEPANFGTLPASGFVLRHVKNIELSNVEIATESPDDRPAFWLQDVQGSDFFRVKTGRSGTAPTFLLQDVEDFRVFGSRFVKDTILDRTERQEI